MKIAEVGNVEIPQNTVNMKSRMHEEAPKTQKQDPKEALTNPMETVGRSQVNFNGCQKMLSPKELNIIAQKVSDFKLNDKEIKVVKQALAETKKEYNLKALEPLGADDIDLAVDMQQSFLGHALKIDPKIDTEKIWFAISDLF